MTSHSQNEFANIMEQALRQYPSQWHLYAQFKLPTGKIQTEMLPPVAAELGAATMSKEELTKTIKNLGCAHFKCNVEVIDFRWAQLVQHEVFELSNKGAQKYNQQPPPNSFIKSNDIDEEMDMS